jgi:hypothetical protein
VEADLRKANLKDANLEKANLWGATFGEPIFGEAALRAPTSENADLRGANLRGVDLCDVKSFYKAKLDPGIVSEIKTRWPEKLATIWDDTKKDWGIDDSLLEQIKKSALLGGMAGGK